MKEPEFKDFKYGNLSADEWRGLIGKKVWYMRSLDIDKSGRNYYFPRSMIVAGYDCRRVIADNGDDIKANEIIYTYVDKSLTHHKASA